MGKKRVLCVDDNLDDCELLRTYLELEDYEVLTANTIAEGFRLARGQKFDLYLTDMRFTDGSGLDLAQQIRSFDKHTPLIFHSASAYTEDIRRGLAAEAQAYLTKPSDPATVIETIKKLIRSAEIE